MRRLGRHGNAQDEETARGIQSEDVKEVKNAFLGPRVIRKKAHQAGLPFPVELRAETRHEVDLYLEIDLIWPGRVDILNTGTEALGKVIQDRLQSGQNLHDAPPMILTDCCTS